jgi:hypothetical protein
MAPKFEEKNFHFEEYEKIPDHEEGEPDLSEQDDNKWWIRGHRVVEGKEYVLAINIEDVNMAYMLACARLRRLGIEQPNFITKGQSIHGTQDRLNVVWPKPQPEDT